MSVFTKTLVHGMGRIVQPPPKARHQLVNAPLMGALSWTNHALGETVINPPVVGTPTLAPRYLEKNSASLGGLTRPHFLPSVFLGRLRWQNQGPWEGSQDGKITLGRTV